MTKIKSVSNLNETEHELILKATNMADKIIALVESGSSDVSKATLDFVDDYQRGLNLLAVKNISMQQKSIPPEPAPARDTQF